MNCRSGLLLPGGRGCLSGVFGLCAGQLRLAALLNLAEQIEGKSQKEAMPVIMGAIASANRQRLNFTKDEFDLIFQIMKEGKSEEEKRQMDDALAKARKMMRGKDGR